MTGEIVNLRKARKARERAEAQTRAAENRVRFGRSKADKSLQAAEKLRDERIIAGKKLDKNNES